jgi:excisionase family DNA binding protein
MATEAPTPPLYDISEAAQYLKLSTHGVRYALRSGHLNKLQPRPGSKIRFTQAMLDEYLTGQK